MFRRQSCLSVALAFLLAAFPAGAFQAVPLAVPDGSAPPVGGYSYGLDPVRDSVAFARFRARMDSIRACRPTVALVLSGGGAKAAAQAAALAEIDRIGLPVDLIVGSSMGGFVGGMYAAGRSGEEVTDLVDHLDWTAAVLEFPARRLFRYPDKADRDSYMVNLTFGSDGSRRRGILPVGGFQAQSLWNLVNAVTVGYHDPCDLLGLPVPFVSVATDLITSEPKFWHSGRLSTAMMTTFSIPGLFPAVHDHGMVLTDGAMYNNNPTDLAYELGADVVIGLDVSAPKVPEEDVWDVADVLGQVFDLSGMKNQDATRNRMDIKIRPNLDGYSLLKFDSASIDSLICRGRAVADTKEPELRALVAKTGPRLPAASPRAIDFRARPVRIRGLVLEGVDPADRPHILRQLRLPDGLPVFSPTVSSAEGPAATEESGGGWTLTWEEAEQMVRRLQGTRLYERVVYELRGTEEPFTLALLCSQMPEDRLAVSLRFDTETYVSAMVNLAWGRFRKGSAFDLTGRVGLRSAATARYTLRTWCGMDLQATAGAELTDHNVVAQPSESMYATPRVRFDGAELNFHRHWASFDLGGDLGRFGRIEAGVLAENFTIDRFYVRARAMAGFDTFDDGYFPSRGIRASVGGDWFLNEAALGTGTLAVCGVIPIGGRFALLPHLEGRLIFSDGPSPWIFDNAIVPCAGGSTLGHQIPFVGLNVPHILDGKVLAIAGLDARVRLGARHYVSAKGDLGYQGAALAPSAQDPPLAPAVRPCFYGAALAYGFQLFTGPVIRTDVHWSSLDGPGTQLSLGLDF